MTRMADDRIALFEGGDTGDLFRSLLEQSLTTLMEIEVLRQTGAGLGERCEDRLVRRNGYRDRVLTTRMGDVSLRIPKLRSGTYFPSFIEPRRTVEKALVSVIQEAYLQGISTRAVDDLVQAMGCSGIGRSEVSRLCAEIQERVGEFLNRPLEGSYPYLWLDATYVKVRAGSRIVSKAVVVAMGLSESGHKEVLGMQIGHAETEEFWTEFLRSLLDRGLRGVRLVTSDSHSGLVKAIARCLGTQWQRCRVHFMRNLLGHVDQKRKLALVSLMKGILTEDDPAEVRRRWEEVAQGFDREKPAAARLLREALDDVLAYREHPTGIWPQIASTNTLERLNKEIKRRTNVVQIFPNDDSVVRLVGAILMEQHDEWQVAKRSVPAEDLGRISRKGDAIQAR